MYSPRRAALLALLVSAPFAARADEPAAPKPLAAFTPDRGFIDDPIAFTDGGQDLAYLTTDGATYAKLHFRQLAPGSPPIPSGEPSREARREGPDLAVDCAALTAERVAFLDGERVVVINRDAEKRVSTAQVYTVRGGTSARLGPATAITLATVGGVPVIVTYLKTAKGKGQTHAFTAYRRDTLKALAQRTLVEGPDGKVGLPGGPLKLLYFGEDYTTMIGFREGAFDKARDIRKPDVEARVDAFSGKLLAEREIPDRIAFAQLVDKRKNHQGEAAFLQWSEDLSELLLVDEDDRVSAITTPHPLRKYDRPTLRFQPAGPGALWFSLTVDPVNPDAVAAKKADIDWIDLYKLDTRTREVTRILRLPGNKRPSGWRIESGRLALLRKNKGFNRGGVALEVYELPGAAKPPATPAAKPPAPATPTAPKPSPAK